MWADAKQLAARVPLFVAATGRVTAEDPVRGELSGKAMAAMQVRGLRSPASQCPVTGKLTVVAPTCHMHRYITHKIPPLGLQATEDRNYDTQLVAERVRSDVLETQWGLEDRSGPFGSRVVLPILEGSDLSGALHCTGAAPLTTWLPPMTGKAFVGAR
jgi:hypothetical protein